MKEKAKENILSKPLLKYRSSFNNENTWALMSLDESFPIIQAIYDPTEKVLAVVSNSKRETFKMVNKLDDTGGPMLVSKMGPQHPSNFKQERVRLESYFEHYLSHPSDIAYILDNYVQNNFEFLEIAEEKPGSLILQQTEL